MYCSGCGQAMEPGQGFCPKCGRPLAPPMPLGPDPQFLVASYAGKVRVLGILWLVYAGLSLIVGFAGLAFAHAFLSGAFGNWMNHPMPQMWFFPALLRFAWIFLVGRAILAVAAGLGLMEGAQWGRIVAIVAAILNFFHFFPFGLALGPPSSSCSARGTGHSTSRCKSGVRERGSGVTLIPRTSTSAVALRWSPTLQFATLNPDP